MVMIETEIGSFKLSKNLKRELDCGIESCQKDDDDYVIVVDGREGAGKSLLARQIGHYCMQRMGKKFSIDNIHFHADPYRQEAEKHANVKGWVNILDESRSSLNKRRSMSGGNVGFTDWFSECRDANQVHILVLPAMHDLDNAISLWRVNLIVHVLKYRSLDEKRDSGYKLVRGKYVLFDPKSMQEYIQKQFRYGRYAYPKRQPFQFNDFSGFEVLEDIDQYKAKKKHWRELKVKKKEKKDKQQIKIYKLAWCLSHVYNIPPKEWAEKIGVPYSTCTEWGRIGKEQYEERKNTKMVTEE